MALAAVICIKNASLHFFWTEVNNITAFSASGFPLKFSHCQIKYHWSAARPPQRPATMASTVQGSGHFLWLWLGTHSFFSTSNHGKASHWMRGWMAYQGVDSVCCCMLRYHYDSALELSRMSYVAVCCCITYIYISLWFRTGMITGLLLNSDITAVAAMKRVHYQAHLQHPNPPLGAILCCNLLISHFNHLTIQENTLKWLSSWKSPVQPHLPLWHLMTIHHPPVPSHIVGIRAADGVLSTRTGGAILDALGGEARHHAILVIVRHIARRLGSLQKP